MYVNAPTIGAEIQLPFGGTKHTGNGYREAGRRGLEQFSETKTVYIDYSGRLQTAQIDNRPPVEATDDERRRRRSRSVAARRAASTRCSDCPARTTSRCGPRAQTAGIRIVGMRHEQGCAVRRRRLRTRQPAKVGVALVTTGPGAANTLGAVGEAWASRSPVVVIATDIPSTLRRTRRLPRRAARVHRPGRAVRAGHQGAIDVDDVDELGDAVTKRSTARTAPSRPGLRRRPDRSPDRAADRDAVAADHVATATCTGKTSRPLLDGAARASQRPLLWVGGGARDAGDEIDALARRIGAPVVTTYQARGLLAPDHPLLVPAPPHEPEVTALDRRVPISSIVVGSDLDQMNTMQWRLPLPDAPHRDQHRSASTP